MIRLLAALAMLLATDTADACSCVDRPTADHAKAETRVVLARAGKPIKTGDALKQTFTVLATFKGPSQPTFVLDRRATPPCAANYAENEIAILMSSDTQLDPCHGNLPLASMVSQFPAIATATNLKRTDAPLPAIEGGLRELSKFLHQRPAISVHSSNYDGRSITIDKSKLTFSKKLEKDAIELATAFVAADVAFLQGYYNREGVRFSILLYRDGQTWKAAGAEVVER